MQTLQRGLMIPRSPLVASLFANRLLTGLIAGMAVLVALANAWLFASRHPMTRRGITDFQDFYVAGRLALQGRPECAYAWSCLRQAQLEEFGRWEYMPWAYPPQFTALVSGLAILPHAPAFLLFVLGTFALFCLAIGKLAGRYAAFPLVLGLPAILINLRCGQNGFLTAGLIGLFAWLHLKRDARSGLALGAMVIKPHLAIASALLVLARRRWGAAGRAALVVLASTVAATLLLGPGIWSAFRLGSAASGILLWRGEFPIERMTSVFATAYQFGAPSAVALALHLGVALAALGGLVHLARTCGNERVILAATTAATVLISPYNYDYDLTILAVALALIAPVVVDQMTGREALLLGLLSWLSAANFAIMAFALNSIAGIWHHKQIWSISSLCILAMIALVVRVVRRGQVVEAIGAGFG